MSSALFENLSLLAEKVEQKSTNAEVNLSLDITKEHLKIAISYFGEGKDLSANFDLSGLSTTFASAESVKLVDKAITYLDSI